MTDTLKNSKLTRFMGIGVINTALDFGLLFLLTQAGMQVVAANIISTSIAFIFSFYMNKKYAFKTTNTNVKRELVLFVVVTLFGLWVLQNIVIIALTPPIMALGISATVAAVAAKVPATVVSMTWNYLMYDRLVFKQNKENK